jgi:hypothetical protein
MPFEGQALSHCPPKSRRRVGCGKECREGERERAVGLLINTHAYSAVGPKPGWNVGDAFWA